MSCNYRSRDRTPRPFNPPYTERRTDDQQNHRRFTHTIRSQFAASIRGVISQQLLPTSDGNGRVLTTEVMVGTSAIKSLILEDKIQMIPSTIQSSGLQGMHTLNSDLQRLVNLGLITRKTAMDATYDPNELEKMIGVTNYGF